jgi:hypothetical protein
MQRAGISPNYWHRHLEIGGCVNAVEELVLLAILRCPCHQVTTNTVIKFPWVSQMSGSGNLRSLQFMACAASEICESLNQFVIIALHLENSL